PWRWNQPEFTGSHCTRSSKRLVLKSCWSMHAKPSMCLGVKAMSKIASGCSSCTARFGWWQATKKKIPGCLGNKLGRASEAYPGSRSNDNPWIERSSDLDFAKRDRDQHGEVAQRESLRFLARTKPQQQNQWATGAKFPYP